jgi:hypothetical protein
VTPLRNWRSDDLDWLPALAKTIADQTTMTDLIAPVVREYGSTPPARELSFAARPDALPWLEASYPAWREVAAAIVAIAAGFTDQEYAGVALWLAATHPRTDLEQQKRIVAGFLLLRAKMITAGGWLEEYGDAQALLKAINQVLSEQFSLHPPPGRQRMRATAAAGDAPPAVSGS